MSNLNRRHLLSGLTAIAGSTILSGAKLGGNLLTNSERFAQSASSNDWALGWKNAIAHELDTPFLKKVYGNVPNGLEGHFYRNGPAIHERAGQRLQHWFGGDGMVQAFNISAEGVSHKGRMVHTQKYLRDEMEGRFTADAFATKINNSLPIKGPDSLNVANISVMKIGESLMALWEAGSAYQMDPYSLETIGPKTWAEGLEGMPFSAHPKVEVDGTIWNFGQSVFSESLIVYKISKIGVVEKTAILRDVPGGMIHDFCMTKKHLVFIVPSLRVSNDAETYLDSFTWMPDASQHVIVLDKDDLTKRQNFELPPGLQFHFGNAYEDKNNDIYFTMCSTDPNFVLEGAKDYMVGELPTSSRGHVTHVVLRNDGRANVINETSDLGVHRHIKWHGFLPGLRETLLTSLVDIKRQLYGIASVDVRLFSV